MNPNSLKVWHRIKDDGRLTAARLRVFQGLCLHGPCTAQELVHSGFSGAWKRLSELEEQGVVQRLESRDCYITGETATVWEVLDGELKKFKPKPSTMKARLDALEARVDELEHLMEQVLPSKPVQQTLNLVMP